MTTAPGNRLRYEASPYLRQHAHNPVDWYPWGEEAFSEARRRDCPVLLSVGYAACHWCHVMERESFSDPNTAELMNRHFVCIKVDREERPDVDSAYMAAVQGMTGRGGWPMTVFLTPEGYPFHGGTYFPPDDRYGLPAFRRVLEAVAAAWEQRREIIRSQARAIAGDLRRTLQLELVPQPVTETVARDAVRRLAHAFDAAHGGFYEAPKFPQPMVLDFLLRYAFRTGSSEALRMATSTLGHMARGGLFDQLGGGFHRYSTDEQWLVPHFEKMLYDNAQLAAVYLRAWRMCGQEELRIVAERTLDYLLRGMAAPYGAFYSSEDADSEGEEGRFYTWTPQEVLAALGGEQAASACGYFGVSAEGHVDGRSVLHIADGVSQPLTGDDPVLRALLSARERRPRPARDEKVLVDWNAMTVAAFAEASMLLNRPDYMDAAVRCADFLLAEMTSPMDGGHRRVFHSGTAEADGRYRRSPVAGFLEDYAQMADALVTLYCAGGNRAYLDAAREIAQTALMLFGPEGQLLGRTERGRGELFAEPVPVEDNAVPSGNAAAAMACLRLGALPVGNADAFTSWAEHALRRIAAAARQHPYAFGHWLAACELFLAGATTVAISGRDETAKGLLGTARRSYRPDVLIVDPALACEAGYATAGERGTALVCSRGACEPPIRECGVLAARLSRRPE